MNEKVLKEIKIFIPVFAAIILIAVGFHYIMPEKIPAEFTLLGVATNWVDKSTIQYHVPIPELIIFVFMTFLQFHYQDNNKPLGKFLFQSKLALIIFYGTMIPLCKYLYAIKTISNIWYVIAFTGSGLIVYLFIVGLSTGILIKKPGDGSKSVAKLPSRKRKKKKKK